MIISRFFTILEYNITEQIESETFFYYKRKNDSESLRLFKQKLTYHDWNAVYCADGVNESYNIFINYIVNLYNECCPLIKLKCNSKKQNKPWLTRGLRNACKKSNVFILSF